MNVKDSEKLFAAPIEGVVVYYAIGI